MAAISPNTPNIIKFASINTQGLKGNSDYVINDIIRNNDVVFICEHWLSKAEKHILNSDTHGIYFSPAEKQPAGRPYGGNCFLIRNCFDEDIKTIHEDSHILAIQLPKQNVILIGVYLTCYHDASSKEEYKTQMNMLTSIIEMHLDESEIIIVGDYQTFPTSLYDKLPRNNPKRNPLSPILRDFLKTNELELRDVTSGSGPTQTYEHKTLKNESYLDHVATLKNSNLKINECTIHPKTSNNLSDHQPVTFSTSYMTKNDVIDEICNDNSFPSIPKFAWKDITFQQNYQHELSIRLEAEPEQNRDNYDLEAEAKSMNQILLDSAVAAFATTFPERKQQHFAKEWWTPELTNCKSILSTHFNEWKAANFSKDENNVFFNRYKLARTNFRKAVKAAQNKVVYEKYVKINSLKQTNPLKFWKNMRQLKDSNLKRSYNINGKETDSDITREFADHFKTLLNNPRGPSNTKYDPLPATSDEVFTVNSVEVHTALSHLKTNKSNDCFGVLAEHMIHAENEKFNSRLALFYTNLFKQQNSPQSLCMAILIPLVKSYRKSLQSSNNYRGISLIPILTKVLEYIISLKCPQIAESNSSQFGFKAESSTLHAEFLINETVNYYTKNGSSIYMCSLDAEKAFDSCNWTILFQKLYYEKHVPLPVVNVLKTLYENGTYQVRYKKHLSYKFNASQGVFQGSILSPHFYNSYTEELLVNISTCKEAGTSLYGTYTGIVAYADDIILMSPTLSGLQHLIDKCLQYYNNTAISLNVDKTEFLASGTRIPPESYISMNFQHIHPHDKLKHLGFMWNKRRNRGTLSGANVQERISKFWSVIHSLIKGGVRFCQPETIVELYRTLAVPTLTYGLELPNLSDNQLIELDKEGRRALKSLFNLSRYSKNYLNNIFNLDHISTIICNNKLSFVSRMMNNESTRHIILATLQSSSTHQSTIHDCFTLALKHDIDFYNILLNIKTQKIKTVHKIVVDKAEIQNCLRFWHIGERRQRFKTLMENRIVRVDAT